MTNAEIIKNLALRFGKSQVETRKLMKESFRVIRDILDENIDIAIPDLGTFSSHFVKKRRCYNPYHKRFIMSPPKRIIRFRPGASIKNELKSKKF